MLVPWRMLSVGGICVAGVVTSPPGKEPGKATTTESPADRAARLPPISIALCRIDPAKRSKKWLSTLARTPPTPTGSVAGDPSAIVTPSGRLSRVKVKKDRKSVVSGKGGAGRVEQGG